MHALRVGRGEVWLDPVAYWDFKGSTPNENEWVARCDFYGPSGSYSRIMSHKNIVNCRYATLPAQPSKGLSPMAFASATSRLAGGIEARLAAESAGPTGYLIAVPEDPGGEDTDGDPLSDLRADLAGLKGKTGLVETSAGGWGDQGSKPKRDFEPTRFGVSPPLPLVSLRNDVAVSVLACCLIPPSLVQQNSDGTAQRESYRRWIQSGIAPTGRIVAKEFSRVLDVEISPSSGIGFTLQMLPARRGLQRHSQKSRASTVEQALMLSGLLDEDHDVEETTGRASFNAVRPAG